MKRCSEDGLIRSTEKNGCPKSRLSTSAALGRQFIAEFRSKIGYCLTSEILRELIGGTRLRRGDLRNVPRRTT